MSSSFRFYAGVACLSLFFLGGCAGGYEDVPLAGAPPSASEVPKAVHTVNRTSTEALLSAQGNWNLVDESEDYDPTLAHERARDKVNPHSMKKHAELTPHFKPNAKSGQDGKMRVLKLQPDDMDDGGGQVQDAGYQVAETSIAKPSRQVAEPELLQKIKSIFGDDTGKGSETVSTLPPRPERQETPRRSFGDMMASVFSSKDGREQEKPVTKQDAVAVRHPSIVVPPPLPARKMGAELHVSGMREEPGVRAKERVIMPPEKPVRQPSGQQVIKESIGTQEVVSVNAMQSGQVKALGMRAAMHPGKTRIAFDFSGSVKYKVAVDHLRHVLRVKFENTHWDMEESGSLERSSKLLGSYVTHKQGDGSIIFEVRLKEKAEIADTTIIRPGISKNHRVVIDLKV